MSSAPPFRVLPWDFFADDNAPRPHVEALQISGAPRVFELLKRGARVYFRLRDDNSRVWATLDDDHDADFVRTFRRAIGRGCIGRVFERERGDGFHYESACYFSLLIGGRGEIQAREWCATRWFAMTSHSTKLSRYLQTNPKIGVFHPKWQPPFREVLENRWPLFYEQPLDEADRCLTKQRFFRGNATDLEQITKAYLQISTPPGRTRHESARFSASERDYRGRPKSAPAALCADSRIFPTAVQDLIATHFRIGGVRWKSEIEADKRRFWQWKIGSYAFDLSVNPSAHEQLEAYLTLRDWLAGKLPPERINEILSALRV